MSPPIDPALRTPQMEIQDRMGIDPLEELLAERDDLVKQVAPLRARHGSFGTFDALRKVELATIAASLRAQAVLDGRKVTEAGLDEAAHADSRYIQFVTTATLEKAEWAMLENRIQGVNDTINRGNVVGRFLAQEAGLQR